MLRQAEVVHLGDLLFSYCLAVGTTSHERTFATRPTQQRIL